MIYSLNDSTKLLITLKQAAENLSVLYNFLHLLSPLSSTEASFALLASFVLLGRVCSAEAGLLFPLSTSPIP